MPDPNLAAAQQSASAAWAAVKVAKDQATIAQDAALISLAGLLVSLLIAWLAITGPAHARRIAMIEQQRDEQRLRAAAARAGRRALVTIYLARKFAESSMGGDLSKLYPRAEAHKGRFLTRAEALDHFIKQDLFDVALVSWLIEARQMTRAADLHFLTPTDALELWRSMAEFPEKIRTINKSRRFVRAELQKVQENAELEVAHCKQKVENLSRWGWFWPFSL